MDRSSVRHGVDAQKVLAVGKSSLPQSGSEPIEAAAAIGYTAAAFTENAGILNRAFCSSLSMA
jgi:hypothetical protein